MDTTLCIRASESNAQMHQAARRIIRDNAFMQTRAHIEILEKLIQRDPLRSARKVAAVCGLTQSTLSRILSGDIEDPRDKQLAPLARRYGLTVEQLRGREPINWDALQALPVRAFSTAAVAELPIDYVPAGDDIANEKLALVARIISMPPEQFRDVVGKLERVIPPGKRLDEPFSIIPPPGITK